MGQAAACLLCNIQMNVTIEGFRRIHGWLSHKFSCLTLCCLSPKRTTVVIPEVTAIEAPPSTANVVTVTPNARTVGDLRGDLSMIGLCVITVVLHARIEHTTQSVITPITLFELSMLRECW